MSEHYFRTTSKGSDVQVIAGWSRHWQGLFLVIKDSAGKLLFSKLDCPAKRPKDINGLKPILVEYGIALPAEMVDEILDDSTSNVEDRVVWHTIKDGVHCRDVKMSG